MPGAGRAELVCGFVEPDAGQERHVHLRGFRESDAACQAWDERGATRGQ
ncbi:MAG: hypothetical protein ACKVT1_00860 [Dehalococcoidia bacterium]